MTSRFQLDRALSFIDWTAARDSNEGMRFAALESFMLVALVAHCGMLLGRPGDLGWWAATVLEPVFLTSCLVGLSVPKAMPVCVLASFAAVSLWLAITAPTFANHTFLEWSILLFLILCRGDAALGMQAVRWLTAIVLFYSGFQKLAIGHYFEGQFLAATTAMETKFSDFFGLVLSDSEVVRIVAMKGGIDTGPYAVADPLFVLLSNAVWIGEMALGVMLILPRTRPLAVWGALALILGIELGAREVIFGCLFSLLVLMFREGRSARVLWPALAGAQLLSAVASHLLPDLKLN